MTIAVLAIGLIVMMADWLAPHLTFTLMVRAGAGGPGGVPGSRRQPPTSQAPRPVGR